MNEPNNPEAVVEAYLLARRSGDTAALERLAAAYPEHEHALTAFALLDLALPTRPTNAALDAARALLATSLKERVLAAIAPVEAPAPALAGIIARAQELQMSGRDLARMVDLPRDVLAQIDRRLIAVATLPQRLLARLAVALDVSAESVRRYLAADGPAARVAAFNYAKAPPRAGVAVSFAEALAASDLATPEQRAVWQEALRDEGLA